MCVSVETFYENSIIGIHKSVTKNWLSILQGIYNSSLLMNEYVDKVGRVDTDILLLL